MNSIDSHKFIHYLIDEKAWNVSAVMSESSVCHHVVTNAVQVLGHNATPVKNNNNKIEIKMSSKIYNSELGAVP